MKIYSHTMLVSMVVLGLFASGFAQADSPADISSPDRHSVEVSGKINLYRVQVEGMNFGKGKNKTHAEVMVSLDSKPGIVYTLALGKDKKSESIANQEIANTLRVAYVNRLPVTLYRQISGTQDNNFKILMVQLD